MPEKRKAGKSATATKARRRSEPAPTVSHLLGEMTWLLSQSPLHRSFTLGDLEWLIMPALIHEQFYLFRDGDRPVALATWAKCDANAVAKLEGGMLSSQNRLTLEEWKSGESIWLVDMIVPFADDSNRHRELVLADLVSGPLAGVLFHFHQTDMATGKRTSVTVEADAGEKLRSAIQAAVTTDT